MRILIYSPAFFPSVGGLETLVSILASQFVDQGHEVKVVSQTPATSADSFSFEVVRRPGANQFIKLVRWSDVYFQPNISLRGLWPLAIVRRPWVASHNNWYTRADGSLGWQDRLKHFVARFATGISVSRAVADHVKASSVIIPNAYCADVFRLIPGIPREKELVFAGRLVSDKGGDLLLTALSLLKKRGLTPRLTIVGEGPEEISLRSQAQKLEIANQVSFAGVKRDRELAEILNAHQIMVVPSLWREPFGIVALEGIACGCVVVGSEGGGLKDAIGPCGVTFPNGDAEALTGTLEDLLTHTGKLATFRAQAEAHLAQYCPEEVARSYLKVFENARQHTRRVVKDSESLVTATKTPSP